MPPDFTVSWYRRLLAGTFLKSRMLRKLALGNPLCPPCHENAEKASGWSRLYQPDGATLSRGRYPRPTSSRGRKPC